MTFDLQKYLMEKKEWIDSCMKSRWMPLANDDPQSLHSAMHYSLFADGKRIRPVLVFASADLLNLSAESVTPIAAALEMIHVFSLIHDDLPSMDDDDLRRGQPTNHKIYGEAVAILAGDALLSQAFIPLTELDTKIYSPQNVLNVIRLICEATGNLGMIGGQVIDLESENSEISLERLKKLHRLKTGALIRASVLAPAILSGQPQNVLEALESYANNVGLAFQIADDILDIEGVDIGKDIGSDVAKNKSTYPKLLGMDGAKQERTRTMQCAIDALSPFGERAHPLMALARFIVERNK